MFQIEEKIIINSAPDKIWKLLTNKEHLAKWNPFIKSMKGDLKVGNQIEVIITDMKFKPKVLVFDENKEFRWLGAFISNFLFSGEHYFIINKIDDNSSEFIHGEVFGGILLPIMKKSLSTKTVNNFKEMNEALKREVENK